MGLPPDLSIASSLSTFPSSLIPWSLQHLLNEEKTPNFVNEPTLTCTSNSYHLPYLCNTFRKRWFFPSLQSPCLVFALLLYLFHCFIFFYKFFWPWTQCLACNGWSINMCWWWCVVNISAIFIWYWTIEMSSIFNFFG